MAEPNEQPLIHKVMWRIIPICIACFLLNYIDRTNIVIAQPAMKASLPGSFTDDIFLIGTSLFFITYCLFELPSNLIQEKVGPRRWIARIMITWGIVSTCFIFTRGKWSFYTLRALLGLAEAGFFPGILLYLSHWIPREYRARASAWFFLSQAVALAIGNSLGGLILYIAPGSDPWKWLFILEGVPSIIMGFVVFFYLTDLPHQAKWLTATEREQLGDIMERDRRSVVLSQGGTLDDLPPAPSSADPKKALDYRDKTADSGHSRQNFVHAIASPFTWILSLIYGGMVWAYFPVNSYTSIFFKNILANAHLIHPRPGSVAASQPADPTGLLYTPDTTISILVGLVSTIPFIAAAFTMLGIARHSDRHGERKFHLAFTIFLMAIGLTCAGSARLVDSAGLSTTLAIVGISLAAVGWFGAFAIFWALPAQLLTGIAVAAALAIINSIGNIVGNFGCPQIKVLFHLNDTQFLFLAAGLALFATICTLFLKLPPVEKVADSRVQRAPATAEK